MSIEENNKLIAEFMGYPIASKNEDFIRDVMKYHEDWKLLMPVVEKINRELYLIDISYRLNFNEVTIKLNSNNKIIAQGYTESINSSIDAYYQAIVEFINWYNENKED